VSLIYKILSRHAWDGAVAKGRFDGAAIDIQDGYIHFSTAAQAQETAAKHFAGQSDLVVAAFEADDLGAALRWEPSRGGQLFPHLYGALDPALARSVIEAPLGDDGIPRLGALT